MNLILSDNLHSKAELNGRILIIRNDWGSDLEPFTIDVL